MDYYNENDPYAAQWLRNLIAAGHLPNGYVDERSITEVTALDLDNYDTCHFFAGIGVWAAAYYSQPWRASSGQVWTGSCPCQPFSAAGGGDGFDDERHLWPVWERLIAQRKPAVVFGEQVASKLADPWIDAVFTDLEALDYACGAVAFPSAGVGAPHIRDRIYWLGHTNNPRLERHAGYDSAAQWAGAAGPVAAPGVSSWMGEGRTINGVWRDADWLLCRDDKWRAVESGTFPLAHGIANRVGRLRAYGNAVNLVQARTFIVSACAAIKLPW